ncbi:dihydrofolate reductase family protein [Kibdelosporangium lantanae]|uniref:Dihydrofolate reductase family protein n=1 Tax=Kibdelosporangium lantanae TaxID=1497396 RepID=A0ABW3M7Q9_9PSEU
MNGTEDLEDRTMKLVATEYVTLDGYMDEPGNWSLPFFCDEAVAFKKAELFATEALLLGRRTYEGFAEAWPAMADPDGFADRMNRIPKYVASRTLTGLTWNATLIEGDVVAYVKKLRDLPGGDLVLAGSGQLLDVLAGADLVDEYRVMVHPIVLGDGELRLFAKSPRRTLTLVRSESWSSGIVLNTYQR